MPEPLPSDQVAEQLRQLAGWSGDTSGIRRTVHARSFLAGIDLVRAVADAAEQANHHPDIDIRWRDVTFVLSTHSAGGVTELDFRLARQIDELARAGTAD